MATYAIGDIQGCFDEFMRLLDAVSFNPQQDRLWLVGDLINRGADSLAVLRWAKEQGDRVVAVLGNHDVHLISVARGLSRQRPGDTLDPILTAPDRNELIDWLIHRPLLHRENNRILVHAGLLPDWTADDAEHWARVAQSRLQADPDRFLTRLYDVPKVPIREAGVTDVLATSVFTRIRACGADRWPDFRHKGEPVIRKDTAPWFLLPHRRAPGTTVIFGHWATAGLRVEREYIALDSGCVWGGHLTALRLDDRRIFQVSASENSCDPFQFMQMEA